MAAEAAQQRLRIQVAGAPEVHQRHACPRPGGAPGAPTKRVLARRLAVSRLAEGLLLDRMVAGMELLQEPGAVASQQRSWGLRRRGTTRTASAAPSTRLPGGGVDGSCPGRQCDVQPLSSTAWRWERAAPATSTCSKGGRGDAHGGRGVDDGSLVLGGGVEWTEGMRANVVGVCWDDGAYSWRIPGRLLIYSATEQWLMPSSVQVELYGPSMSSGSMCRRGLALDSRYGKSLQALPWRKPQVYGTY